MCVLMHRHMQRQGRTTRHQSCLGHLAHFLQIGAPICHPQAMSYRCFSALLRRQEAEIFAAQRKGVQVSPRGKTESMAGSGHLWGPSPISVQVRGCQELCFPPPLPSSARGEEFWVEGASSTLLQVQGDPARSQSCPAPNSGRTLLDPSL